MADVVLTADRSRQVSVDWGERSMGNVVAAKVKHSDFVTTGDTVDLITIPASSFIANLYFVVTEVWVGGTVVLTVGDDNDPNGYLVDGEISEAEIDKAADISSSDAAGLFCVKNMAALMASHFTLPLILST
jgi:hypothetical protein